MVVVVVNVAKVALVWRIDTDRPSGAPDAECVVTFHVQGLDSLDPFDDDVLFDLSAIAALWWTDDYDATMPKLRAFFGQQIWLVRTEAQRVEPTVSAVVHNLVVETNGQQIDNVSPQVAIGVSLHTSVPGRNFTGRWYFPPPPSAQGDAVGYIGPILAKIHGFWGISLLKRIQDYAGPGNEYALCVYSPTLHDSRAVTHFEASEYLVTQRRRAPRQRTYTHVDLATPPPP